MSSLRLLPGVLMTALSLSLGAGAGADEADPTLLTDFGKDASVVWTTVNDGVMGGRSRGGFLVNDGVLVFSGSTNTNGGGFSSIRSRERLFDLSGHDGIRLRVKADGRRYTFRLTTSVSRRGRYAPSYWADFETRKDAGWEIVDVPFERFQPRWRGRTLSGPDLDVSAIDSLGLMIYDKLDGAFRMEVDWIQAYRQRPVFSLAAYEWKRRPLLVFAPTEDDPRLQIQLRDLARTRTEFDERHGALVVVTAGSESRADGVSLTASEAETLRKTYAMPSDRFAIRLLGKDGGVKRASDLPIPMAEIYALIDTMPMRRSEVEKEARER